MKKRILSILLTLCMVLMLCPLTAFAEETHTATFKFDHGTLQLGDVTVTDSPYALTFTEADGFILGSITDCEPYTFLGWKDVDDPSIVYSSGTWFEAYGDVTFEAVYQEPPTLAIMVDGFQVDNTLNDITFSFASTNLGVTFSEDDITSFGCFDAYGELGEIGSGHVFRADTSYRFSIVLDNKGLELLPAVTVNGETPSCNLATSNGKPVAITIEYVGTPAPSPITISGPDVVCAEQDYEFSVTTADGANFNEDFVHDPDDPGWDYAYVGHLTQDEDGVGHGVVSASEYGDADSMVLTVFGTLASGELATATKTVQILKEHRFVDGVCGCGAVQQYEIAYMSGGTSENSIPSGVKTHGVDFTLSSETFTRDGYVQTGWIDAYGAEYDLGGVYTLDEDMMFFPAWEKLITVTAPFTTTVALGGNTAPGETTFDLAIVGANTGEENYADVGVSGSVTTNGAGDYDGTLTITGPERQLWYMLSEGAFVQQVDAGEDGWTYDDTVWGLSLQQGIIELSMEDDAAPEYTVLVHPAICVETDDGVYYDLDWDAEPLDKMSFTNTYTKSTTEPVKDDLDNVANVDTGDNSNPALWFALLAVSAVGLMGTGMYSKRRRSSQAK